MTCQLLFISDSDSVLLNWMLFFPDVLVYVSLQTVVLYIVIFVLHFVTCIFHIILFVIGDIFLLKFYIIFCAVILHRHSTYCLLLVEVSYHVYACMIRIDAANTVYFFLPVSLLFVSRVHNYYPVCHGGRGMGRPQINV